MRRERGREERRGEGPDETRREQKIRTEGKVTDAKKKGRVKERRREKRGKI